MPITVPEPATLSLLAVGVLVLAALVWYQRRKSKRPSQKQAVGQEQKK